MPQEASNPPTVKATLGLTGATVKRHGADRARGVSLDTFHRFCPNVRQPISRV